MTRFKLMGAAAAMLAVLAAVTPASAQWRGHRGGGYYRGGGYGVGAGLATGLLLGGALASGGYYGGGYYGGGPYANGPYYAGGDDGHDQYCLQRYRSYDPGSGTYLGFDGRRHAC